MSYRLTKDFRSDEFVCPCCGQMKMTLGTVNRLQRVRDEYAKPIEIVEGGGYRCKMYDPSDGAHPEGRAVDLGVPREDLYQLIGLAIKHGFVGIGVKNHGGRYKLHLDDAQATPKRPRPWVWSYP